MSCRVVDALCAAYLDMNMPRPPSIEVYLNSNPKNAERLDKPSID